MCVNGKERERKRENEREGGGGTLLVITAVYIHTYIHTPIY